MSGMQDIYVEKITLNIGVGGPGDNLDKAVKLLQIISGQKPIQTRSMKRIPSWGVRPKLPIAAMVTLRKKRAEDVLKRLLEAVDRKIPDSKFDKFGNFSFGIDEYIRIPGVEYDISLGIIGLEAAVTLARRGYRVKRRSLKKTKVGKRHLILRDDAIKFIKDKFEVEIVGKEEGRK